MSDHSPYRPAPVWHGDDDPPQVDRLVWVRWVERVSLGGGTSQADERVDVGYWSGEAWLLAHPRRRLAPTSVVGWSGMDSPTFTG